MSAKGPQTFRNHVRFDPAYHAFIVPVAGINVLVTIWNVFRNPSLAAAWFVVLSIAGIVLVLKLRLYPLKAQDRIIRLEEQLRLFQLLPQGMRGRCVELSEAQLDYLTNVDHHNHEALVAFDVAGGEVIGVARWVRTAPEEAEPAIVSQDDVDRLAPDQVRWRRRWGYRRRRFWGYRRRHWRRRYWGWPRFRWPFPRFWRRRYWW